MTDVSITVEEDPTAIDELKHQFSNMEVWNVFLLGSILTTGEIQTKSLML